MNQTLDLSGIRNFMKGHLTEVFTTMLSQDAVLTPEQDVPKITDRVSGSVGFGGDDINGAVYLHMSASFASRAASVMLGLPAEEPPGDAEVNDVVGEVSNMLAGGLKSWLCDTGAPCAISTPGIIRGASFQIEPMPGVEQTILVFQCNSDFVVVEVHVKFNNR